MDAVGLRSPSMVEPEPPVNAGLPERIGVLVITAYPDDRESTRQLRRMVTNLESHPGVTTEVWFLRCTDHQEPWPGARVIDRLRTWAPARALSAVGLDRAAGVLRGARVKAWLRRLDPDVVLLDDGLGDRLTEHAPRPLRRVVRLNPVAPADRAMEPPLGDAPADLLLTHPSVAEPEPSARLRLVGAHLGHRPAAIRQVDQRARLATRRSLDLPTDCPLVVGWGSDGWLDGPDVFIRTMWALRRRGVDAHGVWFGLGSDPNELERMVSEAERCEVTDRMHFRPEITLEARLCGDVALCTDRSGGRSPDEMLEAVVSGLPVVAFPMVDTRDDAVHLVDPLDVEAAADRLATLLDERSEPERRERQQAALRRLDLCGVAADLLGAARAGDR
jgi:hypothetical protein